MKTPSRKKKAKPASRHLCRQPEKARTYILVRPPENGRILAVGESMTLDWLLSGDPFRKPSGRVPPTVRNLDKLLPLWETSVGEISFTNIAKCYLGADRRAIASCGARSWPVFERQLAAGDFRLIVTLGLSTLGVLNRALGLECRVGELSEIEIGSKKYFLLPIYHPSPLSPKSGERNRLIAESCRAAVRKILR